MSTNKQEQIFTSLVFIAIVVAVIYFNPVMWPIMLLSAVYVCWAVYADATAKPIQRNSAGRIKN